MIVKWLRKYVESKQYWQEVFLDVFLLVGTPIAIGFIILFVYLIIVFKPS